MMIKRMTSVGFLVCSIVGYSLPTDLHLSHGQVDVSNGPSKLSISTKGNAILEWQQFSIQSHEHLEFLQPSNRSAVLNKVKGKDPSHLLGSLVSNGKVYLLNPNGVIIGKDAIIRTADFLASTLELSDSQFLNESEFIFKGTSDEAIINYGTIEADSGHITLIGKKVVNEGNLKALEGGVFLAAGQEIFLKPEGIPILSIRPSLSENGNISHKGKIEALIADIQADGGGLLNQTVNIEGSIVAYKTESKKGRIYLKASGIYLSKNAEVVAPLGTIEVEPSSVCNVEGSLKAYGGVIAINGATDQAFIVNNGSLNASGDQGGSIVIKSGKMLNAGEILAEGKVQGGSISILTEGPYIETSQAHLSVNSEGRGGDLKILSQTSLFSSGSFEAQGDQGGHAKISAPELRLVSSHVNVSGQQAGGEIQIGDLGPDVRAKRVFIGGESILEANGIGSGNGGIVLVSSSEETICYGYIEANAMGSGRGGFIDVSSDAQVFCDASMSVQGAIPGKITLDPKNIVISSVGGVFPQIEYFDPNPTGGSGFGASVGISAKGTLLICKPNDNLNGTNSGAVYLYNAKTAALISTLVGAQSGDQVGLGGVSRNTVGNFLVSSYAWKNGTNASAGALTWVDGLVGISGIVSPSNSLVGSSAGDQIGFSMFSLSNQNFVTNSISWSNGTANGAGAVTFINGLTGISGTVSSANSLVGTSALDNVGSSILTMNNGNYVVLSSNWDNGAVQNVGAATFGNGITGISGTVSSSNSLVGTLLNDAIGSGATALTNGNYVVRSPNWDNGPVLDVGAVTFGNGTTGISGTVSALNSLIGTTLNDQVGSSGVTPLTNGNYVVRSPKWDNGPVLDVGAVTFGNGTTGISGTVSALNSLIGTTLNDQVGFSTVTALTNGNYVARTQFWDNGTVADVGAVTFGNGTTGISGTVSALNSLIGTTLNDQVGSNVTPLTNGNYVVASSSWDNGTVQNVGAVTFGNGITGISGTVSALNSLIGTSANDQVGVLTALRNGNYVVRSSNWRNGTVISVGAVTFGSGTTGISGTVSILNSLIGTTANDQLGSIGVLALLNGNYVVLSPNWDNGTIANVGAATFGNGDTGVKGTVSSSNSLIGTSANDRVGIVGIFALPNGNYLVRSSSWSNGTNVNAGALTFGDGVNGITGTVSALNSLVGVSTNDAVGSVGVLSSLDAKSNYTTRVPGYTSGSLASAGAFCWGSGKFGAKGSVSVANSIIGTQASSNLNNFFYDSASNPELVFFRFAAGNGRILAAFMDPTNIGASYIPSQTMTISPAALNTLLQSGAEVVLQANNDFTISSDVMSTSSSGLTISAGRSVQINSNISLNGPLSIRANDLLSAGIVDTYRDPGPANLSISDGFIVNVGPNSLTFELLNGQGKTYVESGNINIGKNVHLVSSGNGKMTLNAQENNIILQDNSLLQTQDGNISLSAGNSILGNGPLGVQSTGLGAVTFVVDALYPNPPSYGSGAISLSDANILGSPVDLYTSQRSLNHMPTQINGIAYVPGPEFVDSNQEKWGVYYNSSTNGLIGDFVSLNVLGANNGIFTIYYKEHGASSFGAAYVKKYKDPRALAGVFQIWRNPYYNDFYFADDVYPPYLTPKNLVFKLPSLVDECGKDRL